MLDIPREVISTLDDKDLEAISKASNAQAAVRSLSDDALTKIANYKPKERQPMSVGQQIGEAFETTSRGALSAATLGLSEPVVSAANAGVNQISRAASGDGLSALSLDKLKQAYGEDVSRRKSLQTQYPINEVGGQVIGAFVPQGLSAKMAQYLSRATSSLATSGAISNIARAGAEGAALAGAQTGAQNLVLEKTGFQKSDEQVSPLKAMVIGGTLGAGITAIPHGIDAAKWSGKKAMTVMLGPKREAIDAYLAKADSIRGSQSAEQIKDGIDGVVDDLFAAVDEAKLSRDEAKTAYREIERRMTVAASEARSQYAIKGADIKESLRDARNRFDRALSGEVEQLRAIKSPVQMSDDVQTAVQDLKKQVIRGSQESYSILDNDPSAYSVRNAAPILRQMADEMNINAFDPRAGGASGALVPPQMGAAPRGAASGPITSQSIGVQGELRRFADLLEGTPQAVPARELKKILQQIDASEKAMYGQPGFDSRVSQAYKMVRSTIDQAVKANNPAYAAKMEEVAAKAGLLEQALHRFSDQRSTVSRLNSIASRTSGEDQALLQKLGEATGFDFVSPVKQYSRAQGTLKDKGALDQIARSLPEFKEKRLQDMALRQHQRPESGPQFVEGRLTGLASEKTQAGAAIQSAQAKLQAAIDRAAPFKRLTEGKTQGVVENLMRNPGKENIVARRALESLSRMSGQDFISSINNLRVARQFQGEYRNGSRNTVLFTILLSSATGNPVLGGALGAAIGASIDRFGPQMAQKILDGVLRVQGSTAAQKIANLGIPQEVKLYLIRGLAQGENAYSSVSGDTAISRRMQNLK